MFIWWIIGGIWIQVNEWILGLMNGILGKLTRTVGSEYRYQWAGYILTVIFTNILHFVTADLHSLHKLSLFTKDEGTQLFFGHTYTCKPIFHSKVIPTITYNYYNSLYESYGYSQLFPWFLFRGIFWTCTCILQTFIRLYM